MRWKFLSLSRYCQVKLVGGVPRWIARIRHTALRASLRAASI